MPHQPSATEDFFSKQTKQRAKKPKRVFSFEKENRDLYTALRSGRTATKKERRRVIGTLFGVRKICQPGERTGEKEKRATLVN